MNTEHAPRTVHLRVFLLQAAHKIALSILSSFVSTFGTFESTFVYDVSIH